MSAQRRDDGHLETTVLAWLAQLYDHIPSGWLTLFSKNQAGKTFTDWAPVDDYDTFVEHATRRAPHSDVWFGVATRREQHASGRGGSDDIGHLPALVLDVDVEHHTHKTDEALPATLEDAHQLLADFPAPPTAIVNSGHGLQAWWLLDEPVTGGEAAPVLTRWRYTWSDLAQQRGWHLDNVFDLARIMRLPGTWNRKADPVPVVITHADWARRYGLTDLNELLRDPPPAPPKAPRQRPPRPPGAPQLPGDAYNDAHTCAELLEAAGWTHDYTNRDGREQWRRPGKERREGTGATIYPEDGHLIVWTSSTVLKDRKNYDPFGLYTELEHAGDYKASARALEAQGYGTRRRTDILSLVGSNGRAPNGASAQVDAPRVVNSEPGEESAGRLPDDFWAARPHLKHIRDAAHSRQRSADALLHITLARLSAITPHTCHLPGIVGTAAPLSYFAAIVAPPGVGKSSADAIGAEILPAPTWVLDHLPLGSGEGLAEALFDLVEEVDEEGKLRKVKRQVRHNAYIWADEGQALGEIGGRKGSTLLPTIRTIWTGGVMGQANARAETHRVVPALTYAYGFSIALQPGKANALLEDSDGGTPQRFGWASAIDPTIPDRQHRPPWPGELDWDPPALVVTGAALGVDEEVATEIQDADLARSRGEVAVSEMDAHGGLYRFKVAGLLTVLDSRNHITTDDWELAGVVKAASDAVRTSVIGAVAADAEKREAAFRERHADREVTADRRKHDAAVAECAQRIQAKVVAKPGVTVAELRRTLTKRLRDVLDDGLAEAASNGWVCEAEEPGARGGSRRVLNPVRGAS
jgi:hypothetical protein